MLNLEMDGLNHAARNGELSASGVVVEQGIATSAPGKGRADAEHHFERFAMAVVAQDASWHRSLTSLRHALTALGLYAR